MKPKLWYPVLALLALALAAVIPVPVYAQEVPATTVEVVSVSASGRWTQTYEWSIAHSAAPNQWTLWKGDKGRSLFTIGLEKKNGLTSAWIEGEVCARNSGLVSADNLQIVVEAYSGLTLSAQGTAAMAGQRPLAAGEAGCYAFRLDLPVESIAPGAVYELRAYTHISNPELLTGVAYQQPGNITVSLPLEPERKLDRIQVTTPGGGAWTVSESSQVTYESTFSCDTAGGVRSRTATIAETSQSASAEVTVNCHSLEVWPVVRTYFNRAYLWEIDLTANRQKLTLKPGESTRIQYTVRVGNTGSTDVYPRADGHVYVRNSSPIDVLLTGVQAKVINGQELALNCGGEVFPVKLASGQLMSCAYSDKLEGGSTLVVSAAIENNNYHYSEGTTTRGVTSFEANPYPVSFDNPYTMYESFECIRVTGKVGGALGNVCRGSPMPKTYTYPAQVGPIDKCGDYIVEEEVSLKPAGMSIPASDKWKIDVKVPCGASGCTQSLRYWKLHSKNGPSTYDNAWDAVGDNIFFKSGKTWAQIIQTSSKINPYYLLARQYVAANININRGAETTPEVTRAVRRARALFTLYGPTEMSQATADRRAEFRDLSQLLDQYNRGLIGPGSCARQNSVAKR